MDFLFDDDDNDQGGGGLSFQLSQQSTSTSLLSQSQQQGLSQSSLLHQQSQQSQQLSQSQSHHVVHQQQSQSQFYCHNCGGNSSYVDDITGNLVCKDCFTESQTQIAASQEELHEYEIADLAGRQGKKGFVKAARGGGNCTNNNQKELSSSKIPLEELDQSQPLVNVEDCILGMQRILIETTKIAYKLATQQQHKQKQNQQKKNSSDDDSSHQSQDDDDDDDDGDPKTELNKIVLETIRKLWTSYLKSWYDGAEFFGKLYPVVRFSFRDCFLDNLTRQRLIKTLAYWATIKVRKEIQQEVDDEEESELLLSSSSSSDDDEKDEERNQGTRKRKQQQQQQQQKKQKPCDKEQTRNTYADDSLLDDDDDSFDDDDHEEENFESDDDDDVNDDGEDSTTGHHNNKSNRKSRMPQIESMIVRHYRAKMQRQRKATRMNNIKIRHVGRRAAALLLKPSMTMVASMIWIALAPIGITANHIREWIINGSLPLRNCFDLLSHDEQQKLHMIRFFFKLSNIPSISVMERNVRALHVACRYKPRKIYVLKRMRKGKSKTNDDIQQEERQKFISRSTYDFKAGRVITPSSVPMLAARFVSECGLNQKVLDFTLALMGLKVTTKEDGKGCFLPQPLYKARPDFLLDPAKILGVIVVACKLVPDPCMSKVNQLPKWYRHSYNRPTPTSVVNDNDDSSSDDDSDNNSRKAKKRARRFVPCNDHHFRYINHGGLMADYLEFLEEEVIDTKDPLLVDSIDELKKQKPQSQATTKSESSTSKSKSNHQQRHNRRATKDKNSNNNSAANEEANLTVKPSTTAGYYKHGERRVKGRNKEWREYEISSIPEPGQYSTIPGLIGPLIEHMANKSGTSPVDIMNFVAQLDKSMEKRGKPHFNNMR